MEERHDLDEPLACAACGHRIDDPRQPVVRRCPRCGTPLPEPDAGPVGVRALLAVPPA